MHMHMISVIKIVYHTLEETTLLIAKLTQKIKDITKLFFDRKIQIEKVQLTRELKDDTIFYQTIQLPCKNDQGYCNST